ncbi:MAG: hypothetical protein HXS54_06025 [Theionarchaea archaeon]|nr:hypothetical protein [Theionarchaea archaeon]DBA34819.1 TPA_asm: hypothetical protein vir521_00025 [Caudoviricetes sp. vir521]
MLENIDKRALVWALEVAAEYISLSENWKGNDAHLREDAKLIRWVLGEEDVNYSVVVKADYEEVEGGN